uniref:NADH-ubiquinone oxidoreductase chain 6 n=1 Tax=Trigonopterus selaruensis TaxID=2678945 RepID=A0A7H1KHR1_9CUCU|nr:NADH dehydrogenase subunit 6 [Trigonopterus selaruensis]QNT26827.1 NADH dehydrogenase subunit 6 [Trigonopterus selaruensis]
MLSILSLISTISASFMFMNHPLSLGSVLLLQTIMIALLSGYLYMNFWFGYILFLVMVGGMLVMFIYMTSIASNEKFKLPKKLIPIMVIPLMVILPLINLFHDKFLIMQLNFSVNFMFQHKNNILNLSQYFNYPSTFLLISLMIYLFLTLIAIVKITNKNSGTLRQK